ncbi:MAG: pyridoxal phosphate-dependent aminotransferase [Candidatus Acidiferrum sp.]
MSELLAEQRGCGKALLDLTASNPTECGFKYDGEAILRALSNSAALRYQPTARGLTAAREAVCEYYLSQGAQVGVDDVFLLTSTSEAYSIVFRTLCDPGDEILIPEPSYPLFSFLADIQDVRAVTYPLIYDYGWQIDFHALKKSITPRTRGVVVVHPNNPTGHFCKAGEMSELDRLCAENGVAVVADEVFLDFALKGSAPASFASGGEALTFTMSGISKMAGLPQMKAAWLVVSGGEEFKAAAMARLEVITDTYLSMNAPVQLALPTFLGQRESFVEQVMARVRLNLSELDGQLAKQEKCKRLAVDGGWYVVLRVPATGSDEEVAIQLLRDKSVYVHPGHFYDFTGEGFLVLSLITPAKTFAEGVEEVLSRF